MLPFVCRAFTQENANGLISYSTEFWVETTVVKQCKKIPKGLTPTKPELVIVNTLNLASALQNCLNEHHEELASEEAKCQGRAKDYDAITVSNPDSEAHEPTGEFFIGPGKKPSVDELDKIRSMLEVYATELGEFSGKHWDEGDLENDETHVMTYERLSLRGEELVNSVRYSPERQSKSHFCRVRYFEPSIDAEQMYVACVAFYVLLSKKVVMESGESVTSVLRLASCNLYRAQELTLHNSVFYNVRLSDGLSHRNYPVEVEKLENKVLYCILSMCQKDKFCEQKFVFLPYLNVQSYTAEDVPDSQEEV